MQPYTRDDVEAALATIAPYDWHGFFTARIYDIAPRAPLDGISHAGWKLVYDARPNEFHRSRATFGGEVDHTLSVGLMLSPGEELRTLRVDYHEGVLYPHLERDPSQPDLLTLILASHRKS